MPRKGRKRKSDKSKTIIWIIFIAVIILAGVSQKDTVISAVSSEGSEISDSDTIKAGAFNIQVFGTSKAAKTDVMNTLAEVIRTYDIIGIEEIRDSSDTALKDLVNLVNSDGHAYLYTVSERLGRTTSKEQYAYLYNTKTVEQIGYAFTYPEAQGTDPFHREPFIASFKARDGLFNATFVLIHTDPDEAASEIYALAEVAEYAKGILPQDETVIVMGDFNSDGAYFDESSYVPLKSSDYVWLIDNSVDTTAGANTCTYDRIVASQPNIFFTGDSGAYRYDLEFGLTSEYAKEVSDHYPVYARFSRNTN